jgi:hypothetical protein
VVIPAVVAMPVAVTVAVTLAAAMAAATSGPRCDQMSVRGEASFALRRLASLTERMEQPCIPDFSFSCSCR